VVETPYGDSTLHQVGDAGAWVLFRHGFPHRLLPNQNSYRANAWALNHVGVGSLLITSSVGVMDPSVPLYMPLVLDDLLMLENRLPDGSACTMFTEPTVDHGHLVLNEGVFSHRLNSKVEQIASAAEVAMGPSVVFAYVQGPRTKTKAENRLLAELGAQVNSMTVGPEAVLANELEIAVTAVVVGHKYSVSGRDNLDEHGIERSLDASRAAMNDMILAFLEERPVVEFANHIFRFRDDS
jgi:5'-methylthioadenosine phosphorylase